MICMPKEEDKRRCNVRFVQNLSLCIKLRVYLGDDTSARLPGINKLSDFTEKHAASSEDLEGKSECPLF